MSSDRFDRFNEREERGTERNSERANGAERGAFRRRKICRFCTEKEAVIDYRNAGDLKFFISERGKIVPRRISGNCAKHQRAIAIAVKRARAIALIPYAITG